MCRIDIRAARKSVLGSIPSRRYRDLNKWKEDSADALVVIESPLQQSRRGILEQGLIGPWGCKARCPEFSIDPTKKGKNARTVVLQAPT